MPASTRDRLADCERRKADLRDRVARLRAEHAQARQAAIDAGGRPDTPEFTVAERATASLRAAEHDLSTADAEHIALLRNFAGIDGNTWADRFTRDPQVLAQLTGWAHSTAQIGTQRLGTWDDAERVAAMIGRHAPVAAAGDAVIPAGAREGQFAGLVPKPNRPLTLLDLIPSGTMTGNTVPYAQETGNVGGGADTVLEGAAKPPADVQYVDAEAPARTVAHYSKVQKQTLADVDGLEQAIRDRLVYGVLKALESQVLSGSGTDPDIRGILATSGIGSVAYSASELPADQVLRGMVSVIAAGGIPSGVVMNEVDWANALIAKPTSGDGHYFSGGPFASTPQVMWGVPLVASPAIPAGTVLVGDWSMGAQVFIREGVGVLLSDSDQDDFIKNRVTLLGEMRAALAVWRPALFCAVDIAA